MGDQHCHSVGLSGDGDEIAAIEDVEHVFGVKLDYRDAPGWYTANDVFKSLKRAVTPEQAASPDLWNRFAEALAGQTGISPHLIEPGSALLLPQSRFWARVADASAVIWGIGAVLLIGCMMLAIL